MNENENEKQCENNNRKGKNKICINHQTTHHSLDFKLSNFNAIQVPQGWNKLFIYITSVESGKTISKMGKASVQNGECHWDDSVSHSICISQGTHHFKGSLIKLVVAMVQVQCLSPTTTTRDEHVDEENSFVEEMNVDYDDLDNKSDASESTTFNNNVEPSYCNQLQNACQPAELSSNETNLFASGSSSSGNQQADHSNNGSYSASAAINSGMKRQDQMEDFGQRDSRRQRATLAKSLGSSKDLLDAAEVTIKLLNAEAKMWENNARRFLIDVERLQKDLCSKSDKEKEVEMELSALQKECYGLKDEIEQLKTMLEESSLAKQNDSQNSKLQAEEMGKMIKELKDEIEYHKGLNNDLEFQLKKAQKSNINLVSVLEELEKTIEKQKMEIIDLSMNKFQFQDGTDYSQGLDDSEEYDFHLKKPVLPVKITMDSSDSDLDISSSKFPIKCLYEGIELKEFWSIELQEKLKNMEGTITFLEKSLAEKDEKMLKERGLMAKIVEENEAKWKHKLFEKEQEIITIEKKLYEGIDAFDQEIRALKQIMQELEARTCKNPNEICKVEDELSMNILIKEVSDVYLLTQSTDVGSMHFLELDFQLQCWKEFGLYLEDELNKTRAHLKMQELANAALEDKLQRCTNFLRAEVPGESNMHNAPVPDVGKIFLPD
ncbi:interaptin-like [Neltuma alba]|uniref:interaptin-like n=1 Tax=Neltuma alba TaxID=207710 RepID=UPI0010A4ADC1|nr:interaptin-like [Prosopis alba]